MSDSYSVLLMFRTYKHINNCNVVFIKERSRLAKLMVMTYGDQMYDDAQQESIIIVFQHSQYKQQSIVGTRYELAGADLGGGCRGCAPPRK